MIHADLDKILPEEDALGQITTIFNEVEKLRELYVITKSGRPAAAVINIDYLEELTGQEVKQDAAGDVSKEPADQQAIDEVEPEPATESVQATALESEPSTTATPPQGTAPATNNEVEVDEGPLITEEEANKIPMPPTPAPEVAPQSPPVTSLNLPPEQSSANSPTPPPPTTPPTANNNLNSSTGDPANSSPLI